MNNDLRESMKNRFVKLFERQKVTGLEFEKYGCNVESCPGAQFFFVVLGFVENEDRKVFLYEMEDINQ